MSKCNDQSEQLNQIVTILYVSIQISIAIFISIIGAIHVKRCKDEEAKRIDLGGTITLNTGHI